MAPQTREMIVLTLFGALAGFSFYATTEWLEGIQGTGRLALGAMIFSICFFGGSLAMNGPVSFIRTLKPAAVFGVATTALILLASLRFQTAGGFIQTGHPFALLFAVFLITIPFLIALMITTASPRNYSDLFDAAWGTVTRVLVSGLFTGLFWLLLLLSNQLLKLVGITLIKELIALDAVPFILSGAIFGLAIVVAHELSDMISPQMILRLLRLLMPMITVVVAIFVVALPFRGLSNLFGSLSAGSVMMGMGLVATGLVSAAIDRNSEHGVQRLWMKGFVQVLACLIPILGGLAIAAVWIRVQDYGWTPDRLAAGTIAIILFAYGLVYAAAVLRRGDWGNRLRQSNILMAIGVLSILALWLTPLLNPQAISARSQMARLEDGEALKKLPIYEMTHKWGNAGRAQIANLKSQLETTNDSTGLDWLASAKTAKSRYQLEYQAKLFNSPERKLALDKAIIVHPKSSVLPSELFTGKNYATQQVFNTCLGTGEPPVKDCVLISVPKGSQNEAHFVLFTNLNSQNQDIRVFTKSNFESVNHNAKYVRLSDSAKRDLINGIYSIAPPQWSSVTLDGATVYPAPWDH
jgi:hypothetical protein